MSKIKLNNVRLSFPSLFQKATFEGKETKFEATLLLDKDAHAETIAEIQAAIKLAIKEKLGNAKVGADKLCMKDGDDSDYEGYAGTMSLKAANAKRPLVIDRDKTPLAESDNRPYSAATSTHHRTMGAEQCVWKTHQRQPAGRAVLQRRPTVWRCWCQCQRQ
jgi:hypothetical protein